MVTIFLLWSIVTTEIVTAVATLASFFVALYATCYAKKQYERHLKEEHTKLLCEYNQRYSTDCNIRTMLEWMLKVSIQNEKGEIVGVNIERCTYNPGINTKEMFMRFFEELQLQIERKNLEAKEVSDLFAYYALKFDKFTEYHKDITDYTAKEEMDKMDEAKKDEVNENWKRFSNFIHKMHKIEENKTNKK